jgi:hypothetical protein
VEKLHYSFCFDPGGPEEEERPIRVPDVKPIFQLLDFADFIEGRIYPSYSGNKISMGLKFEKGVRTEGSKPSRFSSIFRIEPSGFDCR